MELRLKPSDKNFYPLGGILIKGSHPTVWVKEIQSAGLSLAQTVVYPLPGITANSIWGCLVVFDVQKVKVDIGRNTWCKLMHNCLFVPEKAVVYPIVSPEEAQRLFNGKSYLLHPEIGLFALDENMDWTDLIKFPTSTQHSIVSPPATPFVPKQVKSFHIRQLASADLLQALEEQSFPKEQKFTDKPLNPFEKAKLFFYRQLFTRKGADGNTIDKTSFLKKIESLFKKKDNNWAESIQKDFEALEERNQKHLDRLMDLFKTNPKEALKYAIPLDSEGTSRGGRTGSFNMEKRWWDFSLFGGNMSNGMGATVLPDDSYQQLFQQYNKTAQELIKQGEYTNAAFVYMKLLKNYSMAADTLEKGKLYGEAASVYLAYCHNKTKAAECFEKGNMITNAIELHKELNNDEKVGDLYVSIHNRKEAFVWYQKVADRYVSNYQHVKAALLYRNKLHDETSAQETLLRGWRLGRDAFNCLNNYFTNIQEGKRLLTEIETIYRREVTPANRQVFLHVLQHEYDDYPKLSAALRDMAYEIVAEEAKANPAIVSELKAFNKTDKLLIKDMLRFKTGRR